MFNNTINAFKEDSKTLFNRAKTAYDGVLNKFCTYMLKESRKHCEECIHKIANKKSLNNKDLENLKEMVELCKETDELLGRINL